VCGVGDNYGVFGKGFTQAGVYGENEANGTGVFGIALNDSAIGVAGMSRVKHQQSKSDAQGIGIVGATESGKGFGVVGLSVNSLDQEEPDIVLLSPSTVPKVGRNKDGSLLFPDNLGKGTGVLGGSGTEAGVRGFSRTGEGGQFESDSGTGVHGSSETVGGGRFESDSGVGVRGFSKKGEGSNSNQVQGWTKWKQ
jgi:hypothetical protein